MAIEAKSKLGIILQNFAASVGGPTDPRYVKVLNAIQSSSTLEILYKTYAENNLLKEIRFQSDPKMSGVRLLTPTVIEITNQALNDSNRSPINWAGTMRHELEHITNVPTIERESKAWSLSLQSTIRAWDTSANPGPQPLTAAIQQQVQRYLDDEAIANIRGWNSQVDAALASGTLDLNSMASLVSTAGGNIGRFLVTNVPVIGVTLKPGLALDTTTGLMPETTENIAAMANLVGSLSASTATAGTTYRQLYTTAVVSQVCRIESGKAFQIDYAALGLFSRSERPFSSPPSGLAPFTLAEVNGVMAGMGLDPGSTGTCRIVDSTSGIANDFKLDSVKRTTLVKLVSPSDPATSSSFVYDDLGNLISYIQPNSGVGNSSGTYVDALFDGNRVVLSAIADSTGTLIVTGIQSINGAPPSASSIDVVNVFLAEAKFTVDGILENPGNLSSLIVAAGGTPPVVPNGSSWFDDPALTTVLNNATALLKAIKSGNPLAIATSTFGFAAHNTNIAAIDNISLGLTAITDFQRLQVAFEKGDAGQILLATGGLATTALKVHIEVLKSLNLSSSSASALLKSVGQGLAVLNLLIAIEKQDLNSAVIAGASLVNPLVGAALGFADAFLGPLFSGNQSFEADGHFVLNQSGAIVPQIGNHNGGGNVQWNRLMDILTVQIREEVARANLVRGVQDTSKPVMGVILERLPHVSFKRGVAVLWYEDPVTGEQFARTFDLSGQYLAPGYIEDIDTDSPWGADSTNPFIQKGQRPGRNVDPRDRVPGNQVAQSADFFKSITDQFSDAMAKSGAIAPQWEVETFNNQRAMSSAFYGGDAGLTTQQLARRNGYSTVDNAGDASPGNAARTSATAERDVTLIALDLNHDGNISLVKRSNGPGVLFDVDSDGYAEETDWVGPSDGILVLDRNADGVIDTGRDLFIDNFVRTDARALTVLKEIDKDVPQDYVYYGASITADDPVFNFLRVWMDANGDGVAQSAELNSLASLNITEITAARSPTSEYGSQGVGGFVRNGNLELMQAVDLRATAGGVATVALGPNSLQVFSEAGDQVVLVKATFDLAGDATTSEGHSHTSGALIGNDEVLLGQEDVTLTVSVEQLLRNDRSTSGKVTFAGVSASRGGVASYDPVAQKVNFVPSLNANSTNSTAVGFDYSLRDAAGNVVNATAVISLGAVDDEATVTLKARQRKAGWGDLGTRTEKIDFVYKTFDVLPSFEAANLRPTTVPQGDIVKLGFVGGMMGRDDVSQSTGKFGFFEGRMFFAPFSSIGVESSARAWQEVWLPVDGGFSVEAFDADVGDRSRLVLAVAPNLDGQFGTAVLADLHDGTANVSYRRTTWESKTPNLNAYRPTSPYVGPDDAFYVQVQQTVGDKVATSVHKVIVPQTMPSTAFESNDATLQVPAPAEATPQPEQATPSAEPTVISSTDDSLTDQIFARWNKPPKKEVYEVLDPIVLDLNGNGFRFNAVQNSSTYLDVLGDGVRRAIAWSTGRDGILTYDANGDGKISGRAEISFKGYLAGAKTDLEGLRAFDTNGDGKFSGLDTLWSKFTVWQDLDEDGVQTEGELTTLADRGITSIGLTTNESVSELGGVKVHGVGVFTRIDGSKGGLADVALSYSSETFTSITDDVVVLDPNSPFLATGAGNDTVTGSTGNDNVDLGTGSDVFRGDAGDDVVVGGAGDDYLSGDAGSDELWGGTGDDALHGGDGNDALHGGAGADYLNGGSGDDMLWGGSGDDMLNGGSGADTYYYDLGSGNDTIYELAGDATRLVLGASITAQNTKFEALTGGTGYRLTFANGETLTLNVASSQEIAASAVAVTLGNGSAATLGQLLVPGFVPADVTAPVLLSASPADNVTGVVSNANVVLTFSEAIKTGSGNIRLVNINNEADSRTISIADTTQVTIAGATLTINPTTDLAAGASYSVQVASGVVVDLAGNAYAGIANSTALNFTTNFAPTVATTLVAQSANKDDAWTYVVPATTFADQDAGDTLVLTAKLANGSALPAWLSFNATTRTFSGTPNITGSVGLQIVATDSAGASVSAPLTVNVSPALDRTAPTLASATPADNATAVGAGANVVLKFNEAVKAGSGSLKLVNAGNATDTRTISITDTTQVSIAGDTVTINPTVDLAAGASYSVQVASGVVVDLAGNAYAGITNSTALNFTTNFAPTVATTLVAQSANKDDAWTYVVPATTFADQDAGDTLVLTAKLANGSALPAWLSFNATTRTFSGTPNTTGSVGLQIVATDSAGASVSAPLTVNVGPALDRTAPTLASATPADNATAVGAGANVVLKFNEAMKAGSGSLKLVNAGNATDTRTISITDTTQVSIAGDTVTINPTADLAAGASYSVQVASGALSDLAGNFFAGIANATDLNFVTAQNLPTEPQPPAGALVGTPGKDVLTANSAHKVVWGLGDNDTINGFWDSTVLVGGSGNDTINGIGGPANILDGGPGDDILTGGWGKDTLIGGEGNNTIKVTGDSAVVTAGSGNDTITGSWGNDSIAAGNGTNIINAAGGNNNVWSGTGNDNIKADSGNDVVNAGDGDNSVSVGEGQNVVWSGAGIDTVTALGINVVSTGAGNDKITLGWGNDWVQGGKGNDTIDAGGGNNLFAFNKGDGADTIISGNWSTDTISLSQGIRYADLKLAKVGNDLVLSVGGGDQMTLKAWYTAAANRGVSKLQMLTVGGDFSTAATSSLNNRPVTVFDFTKLVTAFDAARTANASNATGWSMTSGMAAAQLYTSAGAVSSTSFVNPWAALQAGTALMDSAPSAAIQPIANGTQSVDQLLFAALNSSGVPAAAGWGRP